MLYALYIFDDSIEGYNLHSSTRFRGLGFVKSRQHSQDISRCLQLDDLQLVHSQIYQEHFVGEFKDSHTSLWQ